ncbi:MAG: hypothetical protein ACFE9S_19450 [Candidatus Hermodarchaeota archaeon]
MLRRNTRLDNNNYDVSIQAISAMCILRFIQLGIADIAQLVHYEIIYPII